MGIFDRRKDARVEQATEAQLEQAQPPAPPTPPDAQQPDETAVEEPATPAPVVEQPAPEPETAPAAPSEKQIHTVGAGETLADLTDRYGVPAEEIARQNHLPTSGEIHPGQVFVISS